MGYQYFNKRHNWASSIFRGGSRLADLNTRFEITEPSLVKIMGFAAFQHNGGKNGVLFDMPVMVSMRIGYRRADCLADLPAVPIGARDLPLWNDSVKPLTWVPGSKSGGNIRDGRDHYMPCLPLMAAIVIPAGAYEFEPWAFAGVSCAEFPTMCQRDDLASVQKDTGQAENDTFGFMFTEVTSLPA